MTDTKRDDEIGRVVDSLRGRYPSHINEPAIALIERLAAEREMYFAAANSHGKRAEAAEAETTKLRDRASELAAERDKWKDAILERLVVVWAFLDEHDSDPKKAVRDLLLAETQIALDPLTSSDAAALVERGRSAAAAENARKER